MFGFLWWLIPTCPNRCSTKSPSSAPHGSQFPRSAPGSHALSIRSRPFPQPRHQGVQCHLHMNRGQHDLHIHLPKKELCSGPCPIFFPRFYGAKSEFASCAKAAEGWLGFKARLSLSQTQQQWVSHCAHVWLLTDQRWTIRLPTAFCELPGILWLRIAFQDRQRKPDAVGAVCYSEVAAAVIWTLRNLPLQ